jgi:protein-S-isoprenylcysteine O-methyltransferase Ste14
MTRKEFALLSKKARKLEMAIMIISLSFALIVFFFILSLRDTTESPLTLLAAVVMLLIFIVGNFINLKALKRMGHVCSVCHKPITGRVAKQFIMTGICPECGEVNFPNA